MSQQPGPEGSDEPRIDLGKQRPSPGDQPPAYPPPPDDGWRSAPPPPGPGYPQPGGYAPPQGYPPPGGQPPPQWQGQPGQVAPGGSRLSPSDERTWAGAAHWSAIVAMVVAMAFLGPLIVLLVKGNDSPYVRRQAVESLNFQLTILIAGLVSFVLVFAAIGLLLLPLVGVAWLVFTIIGAVKASAGEDYRYPFAIRMVR
jgi:uncharacterized Tic20 family protein